MSQRDKNVLSSLYFRLTLRQHLLGLLNLQLYFYIYIQISCGELKSSTRPAADYLLHNVHIFLENYSVCPLVGIGTPPPPLSPASVPPPEPKVGGTDSPAGEGVGESQFRRLEKKPSTLSTLCSPPTETGNCVLSVYSVIYIFKITFLLDTSADLSTQDC
jgi:hypothetical protein